MALPTSPDPAPVDLTHLAVRWLRVASRWERCPGEDAVEIVLGAGGGRVDLVLAALRDDNPGPDLSVLDRGYEVVVRGRERLVLTTATLRWHLGPGFGVAQARALIVSGAGRLEVGRDELVWSAPGGPDTGGPRRYWATHGWRRPARTLRQPARAERRDGRRMRDLLR